jgi:hypothetical protein
MVFGQQNDNSRGGNEKLDEGRVLAGPRQINAGRELWVSTTV